MSKIILLLLPLIFNASVKIEEEKAPNNTYARMMIIYSEKAKLSDKNYNLGLNWFLSEYMVASLSSQETPILFNRELAIALLQLIQHSQSLISTIRQFVLRRSDFQAPGIQMLQECLSKFNPSEWEFYALYKPTPFILFVPKKYLESHPQSGINFATFEQFKNDNITEVINKLTQTPTNEDVLATTILKVFVPFEKNPLRWNTVLVGHGMFSSQGFTPTKLFLKNSDADIAGMPAHQFIKFIESLSSQIKPQVTFWSSCYSGGFNAKALEQILSISNTINKNFNPGILISAAASDQLIYVAKPNITELFKTLESININQNSTEIKEKAEEAISVEGSQNAAGLIYIPSQGKFEIIKNVNAESYDNWEINIYDFKDDVITQEEINSHQFTENPENIGELLRFPDQEEYYYSGISPSQTGIKLNKSGELSEQSIQAKVKTSDVSSFILYSLITPNQSPFFKILSIDELIGMGREKNVFDFHAKDGDPHLYNVNVVIYPYKTSPDFPVQPQIAGYVIFTNKKTYPLTIYVVKYIWGYNIPIPVYEYLINNESEYNKKIKEIKNQIISNGLLLSQLQDYVAQSGLIPLPEDLINTSETPSTFSLPSNKSKNFKELLDLYSIQPPIFPDEEGIKNLLLELGGNCSLGIEILEKIAPQDKEKILNHLKNLSPLEFEKLVYGCGELLLTFADYFPHDFSHLIYLKDYTSVYPSKKINTFLESYPLLSIVQSPLVKKFLDNFPLNPDEENVAIQLFLKESELYQDLERKNLSLSNINSQKRQDFVKKIIKAFPNLEKLAIYSSHLSEIPSEISELSHLKDLDISNNNLQNLPDSLSKLKNLESINISQNKFNEEEMKRKLEEIFPDTSIII